jgi:hypothetical protein
MDDAARTRDAARAALRDVEPERLRAVLDELLEDATVSPGALTLLSARAADPGVDAAAVSERAAGVQLIYEGLRLTRRLAHDEPWETADTDGDIDADLDILAADVLVARGFYLLARTEAAERAVEVVRTFGRDQSRRRDPEADVDALDRNLEGTVFALAVVTGTTAVSDRPTPALLEYAVGLSRDGAGDLPTVGALPDAATIADAAGGDDGRVPSSATDS